MVCRYEELRDAIHAMKNSQKIKDIAKVQSGKMLLFVTKKH